LSKIRPASPHNNRLSIKLQLHERIRVPKQRGRHLHEQQGVDPILRRRIRPPLEPGRSSRSRRSHGRSSQRHRDQPPPAGPQL